MPYALHQLSDRCCGGGGSRLDVVGAPVNFGGSGGNKIVVNNNSALSVNMSGLAVSAMNSGSISITNPIKNPSLGNTSVKGSLIPSTNGGKVGI